MFFNELHSKRIQLLSCEGSWVPSYVQYVCGGYLQQHNKKAAGKNHRKCQVFVKNQASSDLTSMQWSEKLLALRNIFMVPGHFDRSSTVLMDRSLFLRVWVVFSHGWNWIRKVPLTLACWLKLLVVQMFSFDQGESFASIDSVDAGGTQLLASGAIVKKTHTAIALAIAVVLRTAVCAWRSLVKMKSILLKTSPVISYLMGKVKHFSRQCSTYQIVGLPSH